MFTLTYTQCKALIAAHSQYVVSDFINEMNNQPEFLQHMGEITDVAELVAIYEGGCASGAYMPAVTYHIALSCMNECATSVEDMLEDSYQSEITFDFSSGGWVNLASDMCSRAVEAYVSQFSDIIDVLQDTGY